MEYLIAFSSYYRAAYAREILEKNNISSRIRKTPTYLLKSCGYSLSIVSGNIDAIVKILIDKGISISGVFQI